jgi:hypothetical protein
VGAGVAGDGDEFWTHPAKRIQSRNVREMRRRNAFFMARNLFLELLTFSSSVIALFFPMMAIPERLRTDFCIRLAFPTKS